ncbi:hypothetical protein MKW92_040488 [Papaver armeniacum]|nr:hypothetical protein MKW92_040488 [Papaver armeniacum]
MLKSSWKKLKGLALPRPHHSKDDNKVHHHHGPSAKLLDDFTQASKDMLDMKKCNDTILSAAAAAANSAFVFSESHREMGTCLLEQSGALNDDGQIGNILRMLSKVQFKLQELVDSYRSDIFQTTTPESILNQLKTLEMKQQCDGKRNVYQGLLTAQMENEKARFFKGEAVSPQQLQAASEEYEREAICFVFRLKSLKEGQNQNLLKQAVQHHAAQINLFRKGLKLLEAIGPEVILAAEHQHNHYNFVLEDGYGKRRASLIGTGKNLWCTLPLEPTNHEKDLRYDKKESNINRAYNKLPSPFSSPRIGKLHELPSPQTARNLPLVRHSASLGRSQNLYAAMEKRLTPSNAASLSMPLESDEGHRNYYIPAGDERGYHFAPLGISQDHCTIKERKPLTLSDAKSYPLPTPLETDGFPRGHYIPFSDARAQSILASFGSGKTRKDFTIK